MKIVHCCLAAFYIDNFGYQENILPKMHKLQGHDVSIIASTENYIGNTKLGYTAAMSYLTPEGIPIQRLAYGKFLPSSIAKKLRVYVGLTEAIEELEPDILFLHDCQFVSVNEIARYARKNPTVRIYVDSHTDFINSARTWISRNILHRIIYRRCAKVIEPYTRKFYGTLPLRVDFLRDVYGISPGKLELLVLGSDPTVVDVANRVAIRSEYRQKLGIGDHEFVLISGGKIDERKNILNLLRAVRSIGRSDLKLLLFGKPTDDMMKQISEFENDVSVKSLGWLSPKEISHYLLASDLAVFPGTHSVIWEQSVGLGIPCLFKTWDGIQHVDVGGNCLFLETGDEVEIRDMILRIVDSPALWESMKQVAMEKGQPYFSYFEIAKRAIEQ